MARSLSRIKAFGMTNLMIIQDLTRVAAEHNIELGHLSVSAAAPESVYYPQIDAAIRKEAEEMAEHYKVFYSLEASIRTLVDDTLTTAEGKQDWWATARVPQVVKTEVANRIQREIDAGVSRRSLSELDYTTFGELSEIIKSNWDVFGSLFSSKKAVEKVMASLNTLRNPIAHCTALAEDEQVRLRLTVRDWFRLME